MQTEKTVKSVESVENKTINKITQIKHDCYANWKNSEIC